MASGRHEVDDPDRLQIGVVANSDAAIRIVATSIVRHHHHSVAWVE